MIIKGSNNTPNNSVGVDFDSLTKFCLGLIQLNHMFLSISKQFQSKHKITIKQFQLMNLIANYPGVTITRMKAILDLPIGSLSLSVDKLIKKGIILKLPDGKDARRFQLYLSRGGSKIVRDGTKELEVYLGKLSLKIGNEATRGLSLLLSDLSLRH